MLEHAAGSVMELNAEPTVMKCSICDSDMAIPLAVWHWTCSQAHLNSYKDTVCRSSRHSLIRCLCGYYSGAQRLTHPRLSFLIGNARSKGLRRFHGLRSSVSDAVP
jgi:hypothetical protein